jgi:hypothetical protein
VNVVEEWKALAVEVKMVMSRAGVWAISSVICGMYVCMSICMYACIYIHIYLYTYIHIHTHTYMYTYNGNKSDEKQTTMRPRAYVPN